MRSNSSFNFGLIKEILLKASIDRKEQTTLVSAIILAVRAASGSINASSPKHVPAIIIKVPEIPRTKSGKIVELAVKKVIHGETINNKEAISNPESLKFFENLPQLKL